MVWGGVGWVVKGAVTVLVRKRRRKCFFFSRGVREQKKGDEQGFESESRSLLLLSLLRQGGVSRSLSRCCSPQEEKKREKEHRQRGRGKISAKTTAAEAAAAAASEPEKLRIWSFFSTQTRESFFVPLSLRSRERREKASSLRSKEKHKRKDSSLRCRSARRGKKTPASLDPPTPPSPSNLSIVKPLSHLSLT